MCKTEYKKLLDKIGIKSNCTFTADRQLKAVKFLFKKGFYYDVEDDKYWFHLSDYEENLKYRDFDEALAEFINIIWDDSLSEEEKQEIRGIFEC